MSLGVPRWFIAVLALFFSAYHVVLAIYSLDLVDNVGPVIVALVLYSVATVVSLLPWGGLRLPMAVASFDLAVVVILPLLVTHELDPDRAGGHGYAAWYVPAIGTLLAIVSTRHRHSFAWAGVGYLAVQTFLWGGIDPLLSTGVIGSVSWVAVAHVLESGLAKAAKDTTRFAIAEREATEWQAAREAHVFERQNRLGQTSSAALPLLTQIAETGGNLSADEQNECLLVEGAIRDEIRGRNLLSDEVREAVSVARRRGVSVALLDEGDLDAAPEPALAAARAELAASIVRSAAHTITVRTGRNSEGPVITVVGLGTAASGGAAGGGAAGGAAAAGAADGGAADGAAPAGAGPDDRVELWLEIAVRA